MSERKVTATLLLLYFTFGFKYGIPSDADLVFDVRFLPNPYYEQALRPLTGNDRSIQEYVMKNGDGRRFLDKLEDLMQFLFHVILTRKEQPCDRYWMYRWKASVCYHNEWIVCKIKEASIYCSYGTQGY